MSLSLPVLAWSLLFGTAVLSTVLVFIFSCLVTLSDGQGALVFLFTIPAMAALLALSYFVAEKIHRRLRICPLFLGVGLLFFLTASFVPVLEKIPSAFLGGLNSVFVSLTGKTPYVYARERSSFPNRLAIRLEENDSGEVSFSDIDVTFAWDKVCIFGPYTDSEKARALLGLDWNLRDFSQVHQSDSVNALVFLFEGRVNQSVDLRRGVADFSESDVCLERAETDFLISRNGNGLRLLKPKRPRLQR